MLTPAVKQLLQEADTRALGLNAIGKLRIAALADEVAALEVPADDTNLQRLLFTAKTVSPARNAASFNRIAAETAAPFDLRIEAAHALAAVDRDESYRLTKALIDSGNATQKSQIASTLSQSKAGSELLCSFVANKVLQPGAFDLSAAERIIEAAPRNAAAKTIFANARARVAHQREDAQKRIQTLTAYINENPGDPAKGKLTFGTCLTCHRVGDQGLEIAPPLDGSGHRDLEHLLTAIVDPDAAVEGGYGLYRITKTDGSVVEGLLDKNEALGTTIAMMGGHRVFVPQAEIKRAAFVGGRSFMPPSFGQLPEETIADLVAYISTLKEGAAPNAAAPAAGAPRTDPTSVSRPARTSPNFVVVFTDDQGYGDLSCYGGKHVSTPRIDQMAKEGAKLTSFYVAAPVCTPSRAALMTGCYPKRINMATGSNFGVLLAGDEKGLNPDEITIAEVLKGAGYKTGIFGKWHLGDQPEFLPTRQGFDDFFGIPFSHDIHPFHPRQEKFNFPPLALLEGEKVIEMDPDADFLTKRITEAAVEFIEKNKEHPFFLYVPHPIPHAPLHVSPPFMDGVSDETVSKLSEEDGNIDYRTRDRLFREAIAEIDWSVGQILDTLKASGIDDNTLVLFTSDNGPPKNSLHASPGILRGNKGTTLEGGMREPTVIRWPGEIPAGHPNDEIMTAMDLLPTFAKLAGAELPTDRVIDGKDISAVLRGEAKTPHEKFFYHGGNSLRAVRSGRWKLHWNKQKPTQLYNLETDIAERDNLIKAQPEVVDRLTGYLHAFEKEIAENNRPAGFVENPKPLSK